jgi:hypothetical protein
MLNQNRIPTPAKTWQELANQVPFLRRLPPNNDRFTQSAVALGTGGRGSLGTPNIPLHTDILPMMIFQYGGQLYDYQQNKAVFGDNPKATNDSIFAFTPDQQEVDKNSPAYQAIQFYTQFAELQSECRRDVYSGKSGLYYPI